MTLASILSLAMIIAKLFPQLPIGKWLYRHLAEQPIAIIARLERKHLFFILLMLVAFQAFAVAAPADLALAAVWDMSIYLDIVAAVWTLAAIARGKAAWAFATAKLSRSLTVLRPKGRAARTRQHRSRPSRNPANDDDGRSGWAIAA